MKRIFLSLLFCLFSVFASADDLTQQRQTFLAAESATQRGDAVMFNQLTSSLGDYPLLPYLQYQWLTEHLDANQINAFLQQYADTRYAPLLRAKWLGELAKQQRWQEFLQFYTPDNDNVGLQCQFYWASYQTGNVSALEQAQSVLQKNDNLPKACDDLLSAIVHGRAVHNNGEELVLHFAHAVAKPASDGGWRMVRRESGGYITIACAAAMAVSAAVEPRAVPLIMSA